MKKHFQVTTLMLVLGLVVGLICLPACKNSPAAAPTTAPTLTPTLPPTPTTSNSEYLLVFEEVWSTVNETYFDPDFGGVDWTTVHDQYQPLIASTEDDETFYALLNQMLWELNVSHVGVGPVEVWPSVEPVVWEDGEIGVEVRLLDDQAVITRVEADSSAEQAGLRAGYVIQSIGGNTVDEILAEMEGRLAPPHNDAGRIDILTRQLLSLIYGDPGTCVTLGYLDGSDQPHIECIERLQRTRNGDMGAVLPPAYLEFESHRLESDIGYIRFNTFHPDLIADMVEAVTMLQDTAGIIIDLRGNPGGDPTAAEQLAAQFLDGDFSLGSFKARSGLYPRTFTGSTVYPGPLVVLIDTLSFSASEYFSLGMQSLGRAAIIGERSPGGLTGMNVVTLSNGAIFGFPVVQLVTPDGRVLEGVGVTPDINVSLERDQLLAGFDAQMQAAIDHIKEVSMETLPSSRTPISIPTTTGIAPLIDGTMSPGEWEGAVQESLPDGSQLFFLQRGGYLYLALRANASDMIVANVFIERKGQIAILHASAALGTAIYQRDSDTWQQIQDFTWQCRKTDSSEAALSERAEFLQTEGWGASTSLMGSPNELEFQIYVEGSPLYLAINYLRAKGPNVKIPWPPDLEDDCIRPIWGSLPLSMDFSPERWGILTFPDAEG